MPSHYNKYELMIIASLSNEVVLRPRFKFSVKHDNEYLLKLFEATKKAQSNFIVNRIDDHVFIKIPKAKQQVIFQKSGV